MRKLAVTVIAVTVFAAPALAQDFRASRIACAKQAGASRTYYHGRYGWHLHSLAQSQAYMDCVDRRAALHPSHRASWASADTPLRSLPHGAPRSRRGERTG
jgi:hypothetical protein